MDSPECIPTDAGQETARKPTSFIAISSVILVALSVFATGTFINVARNLLLPACILGVIAFIQTTCSKGYIRGKALALFGIFSSIVLSIIFMPLHPPRKVLESYLCGNLQLVRTAIDYFHHDTGQYPASLDDLVASNEASLKVKVKPGTYQGPYLTPNSGISGTGIPKNPFTSSSDTIISDHWKYNPKTGDITVPDSMAQRKTTDGVPYGQL